ncbi:MAG: hypothetical protein AAFZ63_11470 [Bacteroidota bacterium]
MSKFLAFDNQYFTNLTSALLGYLARQTPLEELRQNPKILTFNARLILDLLLVEVGHPSLDRFLS